MSQKNVRIGIALGGGGAKGAAHIGILRVFEKYGIRPTSIVGTSAGGIIGAAYALGLNPDEIWKRSESLHRKKFLRIGNFQIFRGSLIKDKSINKYIIALVGDKNFADLKIPFATVATDLETGHEVEIAEGALLPALRASAAIPGIFLPVFLNERYLVDGGMANAVPIDHLHKRGNIDISIAVELGTITSKQYISGMIWEQFYRKPKTLEWYPGFFHRFKTNLMLMMHVFLRSLDIAREEVQKNRYAANKPDFVIKPDVDNISLLQFDRADEAMKAGEAIAEKIMPELLKLIREVSMRELGVKTR